MNLTTVYDKQMNKVAYLENAFDIDIQTPSNSIYKADFSLPADDPKNNECLDFRRVRVYKDDKDKGLYRIIKRTIERRNGKKIKSYHLEHVLATLLDDSIFGHHPKIDKSTRENLEFLLSFQKEQNWIVGEVDFNYSIDYNWTNIQGIYNGVQGLMEPINEDWHLATDTTSYPWKLSLKKVAIEPTWRIRYRHNLRGITKEVDMRKIYTRIYPLGRGEGDNQLTIESVNPTGKSYIDAEPEIMSSVNDGKPIDYIWAARKYESASTLYYAAQAKLEEFKYPAKWRVDAADVSPMTGNEIDEFIEGSLGIVDDEDLGLSFWGRLVDVKFPDVKGQPGNVQLEIHRKTEGLVDSQNDLEDRQRINEVHPQGNTVIYPYTFGDNCDSNYPLEQPFYIPPEAINVNKVYLTFQTERFRGYVKAMESAGQTVVSKTSGPSSAETTQDGGGETTAAGGGQTTSAGGGQTTSSGGSHRHGMFDAIGFGAPDNPDVYTFMDSFDGNFWIPGEAPAAKTYYTKEASGEHAHEVDDHRHSVDDHQHGLPKHSHRMPHTHVFEFKIEGHTHKQIFGIWEAPSLPESINLEVDGNPVSVGLNEENFNIKPYLSTDAAGNPEVGKTHSLKISPSDLARISANLFVQVFIQSRI